jgi:hypothetical protein
MPPIYRQPTSLPKQNTELITPRTSHPSSESPTLMQEPEREEIEVVARARNSRGKKSE